MDYTALGKRVRTQRKLLDMTQEELASKINVTAQFIGHIERGTRKLSVETLVSLANALKVSCDMLLQDSLDQSVSRRGNDMGESTKKILREIVTLLESEE